MSTNGNSLPKPHVLSWNEDGLNLTLVEFLPADSQLLLARGADVDRATEQLGRRPLLAACEAAGIATLSNRPFDGLSAFGKEKRY